MKLGCRLRRASDTADALCCRQPTDLFISTLILSRYRKRIFEAVNRALYFHPIPELVHFTIAPINLRSSKRCVVEDHLSTHGISGIQSLQDVTAGREIW
jgi:hypothetical protein